MFFNYNSFDNFYEPSTCCKLSIYIPLYSSPHLLFMIRKIRLLATSVIIASCTLIGSVDLYAHKGEKTLGIAGGYASYNNAAQANLYFQYSFSPHVRIAPELGYIFRNDEKSAFECSIDVHFPFRVARGVKLYPLTGITVNSWDFKNGNHKVKAGFDFGGGLDLYMTSSLKLSLQGKYSLMNDTSGAFVQLGVGYVF